MLLNAEFDIGGVFVPALLIEAVIAFVMCMILRRLAARSGAYRFVWHRALFDVSVYVIILGGIVAVLQ